MTAVMSKIMRALPTSEKSARLVSELFSDIYRVEYNSKISDHKNKLRNLQRILQSLCKQMSGDLKCKPEGNRNRYYFVSMQKKQLYTGMYFPKDLADSQALAFYMLDEYLSELMPPRLYDVLSVYFDSAREHLENHKPSSLTESLPLSEKLEFTPSIYNLRPVRPDREANEVLFDALEKDQVIEAFYDSWHSSIPNSEKLILSPQRLRFVNQQVKLLAYVHNTGVMKDFVVSRLRNVSRPNGKSVNYKRVEQKFIKHHFKARVVNYIKEYFEQARLGENFNAMPESDYTWIIEADIYLPEHFVKADTADTFFFLNMVLSFGEEMEVLEPQLLRQHMVKRTRLMNSLYQGEVEAEGHNPKSVREVAQLSNDCESA